MLPTNRGFHPLFAIAMLVPAALSWSAANAATPVHADPNLTCAGLTPCFATIQEAVDNAGPAPVDVLIFPGTYAESVTLGTMGSVIGGGPGDIALQAVDAAGQPTSESMLIDPAAPSGPGSGTGLNSGLMGPFAGSVTLHGLNVTSPDTSAIGVSILGNLIAEDVLAASAGSAGLIGQVSGDAELRRVRAVTNTDSGISLAIGGNLQATDLTGLGNGGDGVVLYAVGELQLQGMSAIANDNGARLYACTIADVRDVNAVSNFSNGLSIFFGPDDCTPATRSYGLAGSELQAGPPFTETLPPAPRGNAGGTLFVQNIVADGNGNAGIGIASTTGSAQLDGLNAYDNDGPGMVLQVPLLDLDDASSIGNLIGLAVIAETAELGRVAANESLPMPANPPLQGSGVLISAGYAVLVDIQADDNPAAGLLLGDAQGGGPVEYELSEGQFDGNLNGVQIDATGPIDLNITETFVINNTGVGLLLPQLGSGTFRDLADSTLVRRRNRRAGGGPLLELQSERPGGTRVRSRRHDRRGTELLG